MNATALLVIDIQCGAFDGARCPPIDRAESLVGAARSLVDAAHASGTPVVFVQHGEDVAGEAFELGTPHWELHAGLGQQPGDAFVEKRASSSFENTDLAERLAALGATDLVVCGLQSEFCIYNTSRAALDRGFKVHLAQDGHSTWPSQGRSSEDISAEVNGKLEAGGAQLQTTAALAARLREKA